MPFDTALSGIRAASKDLSITGNNIANASTTGFKSSRAEFGDVYATSVLGAGSNPIGSGVRLQDVSQQFTQGSVSFTENELDLAVNGNGFFVVRNEGEQFYTRSGAFGLDQDGFIVNNIGARLQGFPADDAGNVSGLQDDVRIQTSNLSPRPTTLVESLLNLDASEPVLQNNGTTFDTDGGAIGVTQIGLTQSTTSTLAAGAITLPLGGLDFSTDTITFDMNLSAASGNNGTVPITLNTSVGLPATINSFNDLRTVASVINAQVFSPAPPDTAIDALATAVDDGGGNFHLEFTALQDGEASQVTLSNGSALANLLGLPVTPATSTSVAGIAAVTNGYPTQTLDITDPDGNVVTYTAPSGSTAANVASGLNALAGISATAEAQMDILAASYVNGGGMDINLNGVVLSSTTLANLADEINTLTGSTLPGVSAEIDIATGNLVVTSAVGDDLRVSIENGAAGDVLELQGNSAAPPETLAVGVNDVGNSIVIGGSVNIIMAEDYTAGNPTPPFVGMFGALDDTAFEDVTLNEFDPTDQSTYNAATSMTIYDSLGNSHVLTQYFVRQSFDPSDATTSSNHWEMYAQIDGQDVGDPDTTLPPPDNTLPTRASFNVRFFEDGSLNQILSDDILISNWTPLDDSGNPNGALGPTNVLGGGSSIIADPPTSSNFVVDLEGTTQFGSAFSVNDVDQDGFTTGRLSGLNIDDSGIIFARFTNGESQVLGQLVLSDFANTQGLQPVGESMWAENFSSGPPNVGTPGSAALGAIQAGALEESNVDLSEELVALIIAQRNFQASAKTIETANQVTQTIINLR